MPTCPCESVITNVARGDAVAAVERRQRNGGASRRRGRPGRSSSDAVPSITCVGVPSMSIVVLARVRLSDLAMSPLTSLHAERAGAAGRVDEQDAVARVVDPGFDAVGERVDARRSRRRPSWLRCRRCSGRPSSMTPSLSVIANVAEVDALAAVERREQRGLADRCRSKRAAVDRRDRLVDDDAERRRPFRSRRRRPR